jgi:diamine N-acetyltransferase
MGENSERPILNIEGDLVALGPLRRELLPLYQRWINNLATMRTLGLAPLPMTSEKEQDWYDRQSKAEDDVPFTIYERETLRPIGNTGLHGVDHRNRSATFGILIGEPDCRGKGYGTETTRLMLDYAFTALGLHNVMLTVFAFNAAGTRRRHHIAGHLQIAGRRQDCPQAHGPVYPVALFRGERAQPLGHGSGVFLEQDVAVLLQVLQVLRAALRSFECPFGIFALIFKADEPFAQLVEIYEFGRRHLLIAGPPTLDLPEPLAKSGSFLQRVPVHLGAFVLYHLVQSRA